MNQLGFVVAAYAVAVGSTGTLLGWAYVSMLRAERALERLRGDEP